MSAPTAITPELVDAMLLRTAQACLAGVDQAEARMAAAVDEAAFERAGRTLERMCRGVRQSILLKGRLDRERAAAAEDARRAAEDERRTAERVRRDAVGGHYKRVRTHFERVLWDEYEDDEAEEVLRDLDERLGDLAEGDDFLDTPVEVLIARLAHEVREAADERAALDEDEDDDERYDDEPDDDERDDDGDTDGDTPDALPPTRARLPAPQPPAEPEGGHAPSPEPEPPPRPPDPKPYIPPWERLRPGETMPTGSGW